eukprot:19467-Heterococcus_DN1.PRE.2
MHAHLFHLELVQLYACKIGCKLCCGNHWFLREIATAPCVSFRLLWVQYKSAANAIDLHCLHFTLQLHAAMDCLDAPASATALCFALP